VEGEPAAVEIRLDAARKSRKLAVIGLIQPDIREGETERTRRGRPLRRGKARRSSECAVDGKGGVDEFQKVERQAGDIEAESGLRRREARRPGKLPLAEGERKARQGHRLPRKAERKRLAEMDGPAVEIAVKRREQDIRRRIGQFYVAPAAQGKIGRLAARHLKAIAERGEIALGGGGHLADLLPARDDAARARLRRDRGSTKGIRQRKLRRHIPEADAAVREIDRFAAKRRIDRLRAVAVFK